MSSVVYREIPEQASPSKGGGHSPGFTLLPEIYVAAASFSKLSSMNVVPWMRASLA